MENEGVHDQIVAKLREKLFQRKMELWETNDLLKGIR
jgi:hypothetical protein